MRKALVAILLLTAFLIACSRPAEHVEDECGVADSHLAVAIRAELGLDASTPLLCADLARMTHLDASSAGITDLAGLEHATSLDRLILRENSIEDLRPLAGLENLTALSLFDNEITDLIALTGLQSLTALILGANRITSAAPLAGLTNLERLSLFGNRIRVLTPLTNLTNLQALDLGGNQVSNLTPLSGLPHLTELYLDSNRVNDLSPLLLNHGLLHGEALYLRSNCLDLSVGSDNWFHLQFLEGNVADLRYERQKGC